MKPFDIIFFVPLIILLWQKKYTWLTIFGIACLFFSMINYSLLVSFRDVSDTLSYVGFGPLRLSFSTAERFSWYAAAYFFVASIIHIYKLLVDKKSLA